MSNDIGFTRWYTPHHRRAAGGTVPDRFVAGDWLVSGEQDSPYQLVGTDIPAFDESGAEPAGPRHGQRWATDSDGTLAYFGAYMPVYWDQVSSGYSGIESYPTSPAQTCWSNGGLDVWLIDLDLLKARLPPMAGLLDWPADAVGVEFESPEPLGYTVLGRVASQVDLTTYGADWWATCAYGEVTSQSLTHISTLDGLQRKLWQVRDVALPLDEMTPEFSARPSAGVYFGDALFDALYDETNAHGVLLATMPYIAADVATFTAAWPAPGQYGRRHLQLVTGAAGVLDSETPVAPLPDWSITNASPSTPNVLTRGLFQVDPYDPSITYSPVFERLPKLEVALRVALPRHRWLMLA